MNKKQAQRLTKLMNVSSEKRAVNNHLITLPNGKTLDIKIQEKLEQLMITPGTSRKETITMPKGFADDLDIVICPKCNERIVTRKTHTFPICLGCDIDRYLAEKKK